MNSIIKKIRKYLCDPRYRFVIDAGVFHRYDSMNDTQFIERMYEAKLKTIPNLDKPITFNEKLQWLKLNDRHPEYTIMVDKHLVKKYISDRIGEQYVIPTLGVWDSPDKIDFDTLPKQFVLKCNHNSGLGMYICRDKSKMDIPKVKKGLQKGIKQDYYLTGREWPYKDIPRKFIAEAFLSDGNPDLIDYKVHNFNGEQKCILVCKDRFQPSGLTEDFFTPVWEHLPVKRPKHPWSSSPIEKPAQLDEILELSRKLSKDIPFLRTDFYIVNGKVYFSELTFYPASGFESYEPEEWDEIFGSWLKLPELPNEQEVQ